ncbi:MAG: hypothetical protein ACK5VI_08960 [Opitutia bacterium]|jgi:hypothetical protein
MRLLPALLALALAGCSTDLPEDVFSVFIEAPVSARESAQTTVALPVSGVQVSVLRIPVIKAEEFLNTEVVEAGPRDIRSTYLLVQLDPRVAKPLMSLTSSAEARGKQLVLLVNAEPIGLMRLEQPVLDGNLFFAVERPGMGGEAAAAYWSRRLNESILLYRKWREEEGK